MKLYKMDDHLFTRGDLKMSHIPALVEEGFRVIALTPKPNLDIGAELGESYVHIPLTDSKLTSKNLGRAMEARALAWSGIRNDEQVIIHCHAGRNRAPFVAALTLVLMYDWRGVDALRHVRAVRPNAIANPYFEAYLEAI